MYFLPLRCVLELEDFFTKKALNYPNNLIYITTTVSIAACVKECKVVLKDMSSSCDAGKLKMLKSSHENTHKTSSHLTKEERLLEKLSVKTPIAWGKANEERWAQLDDAVSTKLKNCDSLTEPLNFLQNLI